MADDLSYEQGDRVAVLRMHGLTGEIQIIPATVLGVIDEYQVMLRFAGGLEFRRFRRLRGLTETGRA